MLPVLTVPFFLLLIAQPNEDAQQKFKIVQARTAEASQNYLVLQKRYFAIMDQLSEKDAASAAGIYADAAKQVAQANGQRLQALEAVKGKKVETLLKILERQDSHCDRAFAHLTDLQAIVESVGDQ